MESNLLRKQLGAVERQERKLLEQTENGFLRNKISPVVENMEELIPDSLKKTLNLAFYKGFQLVFQKGNAYIEKTYNKDKIQMEHDINDYAVDKAKNMHYVKRIDKASSQSKLLNSSLAVVEGSVLGLLGIGLPDIPLFLAVIVRNLNEIALSYGFDYDSEEEKTYMLALISCALADQEGRKEKNESVDRLADKIASQIEGGVSLEEQLKETSQQLSDALLTAKFIQGIPVVGVIGGAVNHTVIRKIGKYASLKYKKRYLVKKLEGVQ